MDSERYPAWLQQPLSMKRVGLAASQLPDAGLDYREHYLYGVIRFKSGYFALDSGYFATGVDNNPLHALASGVAGPNGVYTYTLTGFPSNGGSNNYWVDVVFQTVVAPDTTPPTVSSVSPGNGNTNVPVSTSPNIVFSEPMSPTTIYNSTIVLRDSNNTAINTGVTYNSAANTAVISPTALLNPGAVYTGTVAGGSGGVTDVAGNALASSYSWTFTTAVLQTCPCSLWNTTTVPALAAASNNGVPIEVGVKFQSDVSGYVSGIRFYKGVENIGTHVGHLWSSTGTLLATVAFANESASGWQTATFDAPVAINVGTVYVVSYYSPAGYYAFDSGYFATGYNNAPLRAPASGVAGPNGVYFNNGSGFPTSGSNNNYWVDLILTQVTSPNVTVVSPVNGANKVTLTSDVVATFDASLDPASVNTTTVSLRDASNVLVSAVALYNATSNTITLNPYVALAPAMTYTAQT